MSTTYQGTAPLKGALLTYAKASTAHQTVPFQYNPTTLRRTLTPQMSGGDQGDRSQAVLLTGAPVQVVSLEIELDALAADSKVANISAQLAQLELLVYPTSAAVEANQALLAKGTLEVAPYVPPLTVLALDAKRHLPVRLTGYSITEENFDRTLNPVQATVSLNMRVLTYSDLASSTGTLAGFGYQLFLNYQKSLEGLVSGGKS